MLDLELIAIIDDEESSAWPSKALVEDLGYNVEVISEGNYTTTQQLATELVGRSNKIGVICDHRLTHGGFADFYGSELAADLYKMHIPAILLTQFSDIDVDTTIRQYRRWLPVMLARHDLTMDSIQAGLNLCMNELGGNIMHSRVPHRTLVEVTRSYKDGDELVAEALIPGWNTERYIRFPMALMGKAELERTCSLTERGETAYLFAEVNIGAGIADELFFENFEWADVPTSSPIDNWSSFIK